MTRYALAQLRHRAGRYLALLLAIVAAVALTGATADIAVSVKKSFDTVFATDYPDGTVIVTVAGNPTQVADTLTSLEQQQHVAALTTAETASVSWAQPGAGYRTVFATALSNSEPLTNRVIAGQVAHSPAEITTTADVAPGTRFTLLGSTNQPVEVTATGHVSRSGVQEFSGTDTIYVAPDTLNQLRGDSSRRVEATLTPQNGVSAAALAKEITQAYPGKPVTKVATAQATAAGLSDKYLGKRDHYFLLLALFVIIVLITAGLVIASAMTTVTEPRRREYALLKILGANRGAIYRAHLQETLLLSVLGLVIGWPLARVLASAAVNNRESLGVNFPLTPVHAPISVMIAISVVIVAVAVIAAIPAARAATRGDVVDNLADTDSATGSTGGVLLQAVAGAIITAAGVFAIASYGGLSTQLDRPGRVGSLLQVATPIVLSVATSFGLLLLLTALLPVVVGMISRIPSLGATAQLVTASIKHYRSRSAAIAGIVFTGCTLVAAVSFGQQPLGNYLVDRAQVTHDADITLNGLGGSITPETVNALRSTPGVTTVVTPQVIAATANGNQLPVFGLNPQDTTAITGVSAPAPDEIAVGLLSPLRGAVADGARIELTFPDETTTSLTARYQPIPFDIVDASHNVHAYPAFPAELPAEVQADLQQKQAATPVVLIDGNPATVEEEKALVNAVDQVITTNPTPVSLLERYSSRHQVVAAAQRVLTIANLMTAVALIIAAIGVANTIILSIGERRRARTLLHAIGDTRSHYTATIALETMVLALPAALAGSLTGEALGLWTATTLISDSASSAFVATSLGTTLLITAAGTVVALIAALVGLVLARRDRV